MYVSNRDLFNTEQKPNSICVCNILYNICHIIFSLKINLDGFMYIILHNVYTV